MACYRKLSGASFLSSLFLGMALLPGTALAGGLSASPAAIHRIEQQGIGNTPVDVSLTNTGTSVTLGQASITGANAGDFSVISDYDSCSGAFLGSGISCSLRIAVTPSAAVGTIESAQLQFPYGAKTKTVAISVHVARPFVTLTGTASGYDIVIDNISASQIGLDWDSNNVTFAGDIKLPHLPHCVDFLGAHSKCVIGPLSDPAGGGGEFDLYKGGPAVVILTP